MAEAPADLARRAAERLRLPPHSVEAEQSLLGGLMLDQRAWDQIADVVAADDLYRADHRLIFGAVAALVERNQPPDVVTVSEHLQRLGQLEAAGGLPYLARLVEDTPSAANIRAYARIVRDHAMLRKLTPELVKREIEEPAVADPPRGYEAKGAHWVRPDLVAEIAFTEWSRDGALRHPSFQGLRPDKKAADVVRERPDDKPAAAKKSAPMTSPSPENVRHSPTGSPANHPIGPRRGGGGGATGAGGALVARRRRELDCRAMITPGNSPPSDP